MITINGIATSPNQIFRTPLEDGTIVTAQLFFRPSCSMWFIDVSYDNFVVRGIRVCNNLNLLRQYKNIVPFGLFVQIEELSEPILINDFTTNRVKLNYLDTSEVEELEQAYKDFNE